jgi:hypothetical protein
MEASGALHASGAPRGCLDGTCVVGLELRSNQLSGVLPSSLGVLQDLQELDLANNNLRGALPMALAQLPHLHTLNLEDNNFSYDMSDSSTAHVLWLCHRVGGVDCFGLPPLSCSAFGKVRTISLPRCAR